MKYGNLAFWCILRQVVVDFISVTLYKMEFKQLTKIHEVNVV